MSRVLFNGKALREPTAASQLQIGVQPAVNPNATNRVAVMGPSDGGVPNQVYTFNSYADARAVLRGGDSLKAISYVFNPSPQYGGAAQIDFIRTDKGCTQAAVTLQDATAKLAVVVTAADYGIWTNGIQVNVAAGVIDPTARILTVKIPDAPLQSGLDGVTSTTGGNFFDAPSAKFISNGAKIGDTILVEAVAGGVVTGTTVKVYTIAGVVSETRVTLNEVPTVGATLGWFHVRYSRVQVSPEINAVGGTASVNASFVNWINTYCGDVLTAALSDLTAAIIVVTVGANPLINGTQTAMTNTEITNALALLRTRPVNHLYVARACGDEGAELNFAGLLSGHLHNDAETPGYAYIGAMADKTVAHAQTYAATVNTGRVVYGFQVLYDTPLSGIGTEQVPAYLWMAKVAGLAAGLPSQTPLTRKPINMLGIKALPAGAVLDKPTRESLIASGILHVFQPSGSNAFVINQGCTTLQSNLTEWDIASGESSELSLMRIVDTILNDLKTSAAATFIGGTSTLARPVVEHFAASYLESRVGTLLTGYQNVQVTQVQDKWSISFGLVPAYPINFVLITGVVVG